MKTTRDYVFFWETAEIYSNCHSSVFTDEAGYHFFARYAGTFGGNDHSITLIPQWDVGIAVVMPG
jgi:hypothetical protein